MQQKEKPKPSNGQRQDAVGLPPTIKVTAAAAAASAAGNSEDTKQKVAGPQAFDMTSAVAAAAAARQQRLKMVVRTPSQAPRSKSEASAKLPSPLGSGTA